MAQKIRRPMHIYAPFHLFGGNLTGAAASATTCHDHMDDGKKSHSVRRGVMFFFFIISSIGLQFLFHKSRNLWCMRKKIRCIVLSRSWYIFQAHQVIRWEEGKKKKKQKRQCWKFFSETLWALYVPCVSSIRRAALLRKNNWLMSFRWDVFYTSKTRVEGPKP